MAEETKQEEAKTDQKKVFSTILKVILGIVFLGLGVVAVVCWLPSLWILIKGCIGPFLILAGIITLAIAKD